jgi:FKBP-type peptidyl-prolyl cis-trans isomerase SlyD
MSKETIKNGKYVSLTYRIEDDKGNTLEHNDMPVGYILGGDQELIGGMDRAMFGKSAGDSVEMTVPPEQGFGPRDPALAFTDDIENVPPQFRQIGAEVQMQNDAGEAKTFYVTEIRDGKLTIDGNHPMAGKTLKVKVRILEVRDPTDADRQSTSAPQMYH